MSDSLFLDPFSQPPQDPGNPVQRDGEQSAGETPTSWTVVVPLPADRAGEAFLEYAHLWWPDALRVCGAESHVGFEDGSLMEEGVGGDRHRWADVVGVEGTAMTLRWYGTAGEGREMQGTEVVIDFTPESTERTDVTVQADGPTSVLQDWRPALEGYARFTGGSLRTAGT